jgi:alpha-ketoglutarate-dependent 2,4-dichlorophenoxyacetate dioxygenase
VSLTVKQLHPLFAAEVTGIDLHLLTDPDLPKAVERVMDGYAVSVLRRQMIDDEQQVRFTRLYGDLEVQPDVRSTVIAETESPRIRHREIFDVSNLDQAGRVLPPGDDRRSYALGNQLWHTDSSFRQLSATYSMLSARIIPPVGGDTEFVDTRAVYDALPEVTKNRIEDLVAEHSIWHSRSLYGGYQPSPDEIRARPPARHQLVRRHSGSGRKALYIARHISHIVGWPMAEGQALIDELIDFATQPEFVYSHKWRVGDLVIWDNRCTMHRATPFDDMGLPRDMRRTTVREKVAVVP